jgi:hypothetical protein
MSGKLNLPSVRSSAKLLLAAYCPHYMCAQVLNTNLVGLQIGVVVADLEEQAEQLEQPIKRAECCQSKGWIAKERDDRETEREAISD